MVKNKLSKHHRTPHLAPVSVKLNPGIFLGWRLKSFGYPIKRLLFTSIDTQQYILSLPK